MNMKIFIIFLFLIYITPDAMGCQGPRVSPEGRAWQIGASTVATAAGVLMGLFMVSFNVCAGQKDGCAVAFLPPTPGAVCLVLASVAAFRDHYMRMRGYG